MNGFFINIDGFDGSGKTTQSKLLVNKLNELQYSAILTTEPTHDEIGMIFRNNLLPPKKYSAEIDALIVSADRLDHCDKIIIPNYNKGKIIVSDRYLPSTICYQSTQNVGMSVEWLKSINKFAFLPNIVIILDISIDEANKRIEERKETRTKFENIEFLQKLRLKFIKNITYDDKPNIPYIVLNVNGLSIEKVHSKIMDILKPYLEQIKKDM